MKPVTAISAVAVGAVVGALIGYAVWGRGGGGTARMPKAAVIVLEGAAGSSLDS